MKNNEVKWRIVEKDDKFYVEKKYFNIFWYSFSWDKFGETLTFFIFFCGGTSALLAAFIYYVFTKNYYLPMFFSFWGIWTLLMIFGNTIHFETYSEAEFFIKNKIKEKAKANITEFSWSEGNISIEKSQK